METTWRARPLPVGQLAFIVLTALMVVALAATALVVGSRLLAPRTDDPHRVVTAPIPQGGAAIFAFSSRFGGGNDDIYTARADGTEVRRITSGAVQEFGPGFSPDGSRIAFYTNAGGYALSVVDASGLVTLHGGLGCFSNLQTPVWTADGRFIIYPRMRPPATGCDDTKLDLYVIPSDGSAEGRRLFPDSMTSYTSSASLSPDGRRLAFRAIDEQGVSGLWVADITDPAAPWDLPAQQVSTTATYSTWSWDFPRWSPDGTTIATTVGPTSDNPVKADTILVAADGSGETLLWPSLDVDNAWPEWAADGGRLSVVAHQGIGVEGDPYDLYLMDPDGGSRLRVDAPALTGAQGAAFSPDGTRVLSLTPVPIAGADHLYVITLDGSVAPVEFPGRTIDWQPVVSPLDWAPLAEGAGPLASLTP